MSNGTIAPDEVEVSFIADDEAASALGPVLQEAAAIALDTETVIERDEDGNPVKRDLGVDAEGDGPGECRVISIAVRMPDESLHAYVLDMGYVTHAAAASILNGLRLFMWNAPFDRLVLRRLGVAVDSWDVMIAEAIERTGAGVGDARHYTSLAKATKRWLGFDVDGKKSTRLDYRPVSERPELTADEISYAAVDAVATLMLARTIGAKLSEAGLTDTFVRDCNGQPFIAGMTNAGLPMDVEGYTKDIDIERRAMNVASERVALATTGREMLETLFNWGKATGRLAAESYDADATLELMHQGDVFAAFLADVSAQAAAARERMGTVLGLTAVVDLFADTETTATFTPLPFDPDNDVEVRRWTTKTVPHFAAALALATRDEGTFSELASASAAEVLAAAGRRKALTKDHDLDTILTLAKAGVADVTEQVASVAVELAAYRRYSRILTHYARDEQGAAETFLVPTWDLASAPQVKAMFNRFYPDLVRGYTERTMGEARLFETADSVDADAMKMIGGELADALLEFRKRSKIVSTYGDEMLRLVNPITGRLHARYNQSLTGTGRLSSFKPNAQNLSPLVKPYIRPPLVDGVVRRVLVCADLSQAELRFVADASQDIEMLTAFRSGEDLHERTASLMFSIDMKALKAAGSAPVTELVGTVAGIESFAAAEQAKVDAAAAAGGQHQVLGADELHENQVGKAKVAGEAYGALLAKALYKTQRGKAKSVAFGYAYGLKGASLARQLTVNGVPTTKEEADGLLAAFDEAYPQLAAWMAARVAFIDNLSSNMRNSRTPSGVDFAATWLLHNTHAKSHSAWTALVKTLERNPTDDELANRLKPALVEAEKALAADAAAETDPISAEEVAARQAVIDSERVRVAKLAHWALNYDHSVALRPDGSPWEFESRTAGGRRRRFQVVSKQLMMSVVNHVARSRREDLLSVRDGWVGVYNTAKAAEHAAAKEIGKARGEFKPVSLVKKDGSALESRELEKVFEDAEMRNDFVAYLLSQMSASQMEKVWRVAMADRIRAMGNQYRNHPIQGGVADAVMVAFGDIYRDLSERFPTAQGIQSVHDSIVVECDVADAAEVRDLVVKRMQDALASFCPTVPCVADGDVQLSLDDSTIVSAEQLAELVSLAQAA